MYVNVHLFRLVSESCLNKAQFSKASALTGEEFLGKLDYYANAWLPARDILIASLQKSKKEIDPSGKIILMTQYLPWKVSGQPHNL